MKLTDFDHIFEARFVQQKIMQIIRQNLALKCFYTRAANSRIGWVATD